MKLTQRWVYRSNVENLNLVVTPSPSRGRTNIVWLIMNGAKLGDLIYIIMGCSVPRSVDGEGEIYGPGVTHGKDMAAPEDRKLVLRDFELH
jgi:hypothetical protein